ncbi:MAG: hypothetical protein FWC91_14285 [Defluviitaleaceae bacterium]|nr:hypothetical protein [Defluviitaleaceae bacterium]
MIKAELSSNLRKMFYYRAGAIIIEDNHVYKSFGMDGAKEYLYWLPLGEMADIVLLPEFFKTRLHNLPLFLSYVS